MDGNTVGNQIKSLRMARNITQEEFASRINVAKSTVSSYENGSRLPSYDILVKIAQLFHVSTDNLLGCSNTYVLNVTGLTLKQQHTIQEIIEAYLAYNKAQNLDEMDSL